MLQTGVKHDSSGIGLLSTAAFNLMLRTGHAWFYLLWFM